MGEPKVTVVIPVYNVATYIEKCATSLFEQTLDSLEILFVDDCSPDHSVEIIKKTLKKYPERNSLTRIIRMPSNSGLAAVRRQGIIEATGQYIIHCDGDDWVDSDLYEIMYNKAVKDNADVEKIKQEMLDNIDMRRWICVSAEQLYITNSGNVIFSVMADKDIAKAVYNDFKKYVNNNIGKELEKSNDEEK